jgi:hypothetical protein
MKKYQTNSPKLSGRRDLSTLASKSTGDAQEQQHAAKKKQET